MHASTVVRRLFDLPPRRILPPPIPAEVVTGAFPVAGQITLLGGPSGGGKSRLLRAIRDCRAPTTHWIEPTKLRIDPTSCVIDALCDALEGDEQSHIEAALELLSRVGLAEAWTYLQKPHELSEGQRWRLRLAIAVARALHVPAGEVVILAIDEFCAVLDRVTARIVARALRRLIDRPGPAKLAAVVATSHDDLPPALMPDRTVTADFGVYRMLTR
ncbi:MAG: ATP-binding cassette domain-containing protein [Tepidisphaeraceae bacterium]